MSTPPQWNGGSPAERMRLSGLLQPNRFDHPTDAHANAQDALWYWSHHQGQTIFAGPQASYIVSGLGTLSAGEHLYPGWSIIQPEQLAASLQQQGVLYGL